jgi:hypothetical protein
VQERCVKEIKKHGWKLPGTATVKTGKDTVVRSRMIMEGFL